MSDLIRLPTERAEQLRALASNLGLTVADTIGRLINQEIEAGNLPNVVPGFEVGQAGDDLVYFSIDGQDATIEATRSKADALKLADAIERAAERQRPFTVLDMDLCVIVSRIGTGVKFSDPHGRVEKTVSPSVASDVAKLLRNAAA